MEDKNDALFEDVVERYLEGLMDLDIGSKEAQIAADSLFKLKKAWNDEAKIGCDYDIEERKLEQNVSEINAKNFVEEKKIEVEKKKIEADVNRRKGVSFDTIVSCGTMAILTLLGFNLEKGGYMIPKGALKFADKIKIFK